MQICYTIIVYVLFDISWLQKGKENSEDPGEMNMDKIYDLGIDVGSTTVKTVIVDDDGNFVYDKYERHFSKVRETVAEQLKRCVKLLPSS